MQKILMAAVAAIIVIGFAASPAHAQLDQTWVASNGSNSNPCTYSLPCADFAGAHSKTNPNGEIGCIDTSQFGGALTITKAITIDCTNVRASVVASVGNAITVTVPGGTKVVLRGLDIQGVGNGNIGVLLTQGGVLHIEKCVIHNFNGTGLYAIPNNATELYVLDTSSTDNAGNGMFLQPSGGPNVNVVLARVRLNNNTTGVFVDGTSGAPTRVQVINSTVSGNFGTGLLANTSNAQPTTITVVNTLLSGNLTGVTAGGPGAAVLLNGNTITNNSFAMQVGGGTGALFSYGNNAINDNGSPGNAPTVIALR